jgi:hypothetical protein
MADKTVIVEINYDTTQAIKDLDSLTASIEGEKVMQAKLKAELEAGTISQKEYSIQVEQSKNTASKANTERKATINLLGAEKGSISELKAEIKRLSIENDGLNLKTAEGRKQLQQNNAQINVLRESLKGASSDTGKTKGAFASLGNSLSSLPGPIGGVIQGIGGMTKAGLAFIATPIGLVLAAIALALKALMSYFKGSEEGQNNLNKVLNYGKAIWEALMNVVEKVGKIIFEAISKPRETIEKLGELIKENLINRFKAFGVMGNAIVKIFSGDFKAGFKQLANGAIQATTGVENAIDKIKKLADDTKAFFKGVAADVEANLKMANRLSALQADIDKRERNILVARAKNDTEVSELRLKATEKDIYSQKERLAFLQAASDKIEGFTKNEEQLAKAKYDAAVLNLKISGDDKEALMAVAQAEADLIRVRKDSLDERRNIQKQISTLILAGLEDEEKQRKAVEDRLKEEAELDKKRDEILQKENERRGEAIAKLAEIKAQELELEAKSIQEKYQVQADAAQADMERQLEQEGLLDEEKAVIREEFNLRLLEIDANYQAELAAQRQAALDQSLADMQAIIDATQGMADARVTIMSDAFSKLATINFKEIKSAAGAFSAIGLAARGLTDLIVSNHDKEFASLENQKTKELALHEGDQAAQEEINKKYAKKEQQVKKKQFEDDKKKAIIDASIATALAVLNGLQTKPLVPMGLIMAGVAAVLGGTQIGLIASRYYTPSSAYAKGGIIGGQSHAQGGTKFYGSDGSMFEAERGEAMFVLKKDATAEIAALSQINESKGGRSFIAPSAAHLQEGGQAEGINISKMINDEMQRTPVIVQLASIETGLTNYKKVKNAALI